MNKVQFARRRRLVAALGHTWGTRPRLSFPLPTAPGLGVTFDEAVADKFPFEFWEAPHWQRRDGSYTNW